MYYREHGRPHFHAGYGEHRATIAIDTLEVLAGSLPERALRLVREWASCIASSWESIGGGRGLRSRWSRSSPCRSMGSMPDLVHVTAVAVLGDHRLRLAFEDG